MEKRKKLLDHIQREFDIHLRAVVDLIFDQGLERVLDFVSKAFIAGTPRLLSGFVHPDSMALVLLGRSSYWRSEFLKETRASGNTPNESATAP